jgi:hypothetical protein
MGISENLGEQLFPIVRLSQASARRKYAEEGKCGQWISIGGSLTVWMHASRSWTPLGAVLVGCLMLDLSIVHTGVPFQQERKAVSLDVRSSDEAPH